MTFCSAAEQFTQNFRRKIIFNLYRVSYVDSRFSAIIKLKEIKGKKKAFLFYDVTVIRCKHDQPHCTYDVTSRYPGD